MYEVVAFPSQGTMLKGKLYLPQDIARPSPMVIMAHGFSTTIEGMVADRVCSPKQRSDRCRCRIVRPDEHTLILTSLTAFRWLIEYGRRFKSNWGNRVTMVIPETQAPSHSGLCAPHLQAPLLMIIARDDEARHEG